MLCTKCAPNMHIMNIGHCSACGGMTSSGSFKLCTTCSQTKNQCQCCLAPLSPAATPNSGSGADTSAETDSQNSTT